MLLYVIRIHHISWTGSTVYFTDPFGFRVKYTELNFVLLDIQSKAFLNPDKTAN